MQSFRDITPAMRQAPHFRRLVDCFAKVMHGALETFWALNSTDTAYGLFYVTPPEGVFIYPLVLSEQKCDEIAREYFDKGWRHEADDSFDALRKCLRWATGEPWHTFDLRLNDLANELLTQSIREDHIALFDGQTEAICMEALQSLDGKELFNADRPRPVFGVTYRIEMPEETLDWLVELNDPHVVANMRSELFDRDRIKSPS